MVSFNHYTCPLHCDWKAVVVRWLMYRWMVNGANTFSSSCHPLAISTCVGTWKVWQCDKCTIAAFVDGRVKICIVAHATFVHHSMKAGGWWLLAFVFGNQPKFSMVIDSTILTPEKIHICFWGRFSGLSIPGSDKYFKFGTGSFWIRKV